MNNKDRKTELLSRRDFFKKATKKTLPFIAAMVVPSFLQSCGGDDPLEEETGCSGCSHSCQGSCKDSCAGSSSSTSCSDCSSTCSNTCAGSSTGNNNEEDKITAVDLGLSVLWASADLGYTKADQYVTKEYYWGDASGEMTSDESKEFVDSEFPYEDGVEYNICGTQYDIARAKLGGDWRLPTETEMYELSELCTFKYESSGGVMGARITGPNGKSIFLPNWSETSIQGSRLGGIFECEYEKRCYWFMIFSQGTTDKKWTFRTSLGVYEKDDDIPKTPIRAVRKGGSGCSDCASGCTMECSTTCSKSCKESCKYGCGNDCTSTCKEACKGGCRATCKDDCNNNCKESCKDGCQTECTGGCKTGCSGGCKSGCTGGCQTSCTDSCKNQCKGSCTSSCSVACSEDCSGACRGGCYGSCETGCENACPQSCGAGCGGSCGFNCSFSCGNTCHKTAF